MLLSVESNAQQLIAHPWQGRRVAYLGDSITDPRNDGSKQKYWNFLQEWLQIEPYVYAKSGRKWNDIPRQAAALLNDHRQDFDAILIFIGTNDYNSGTPIGQWYDEHQTTVMAGIHEQKHIVERRQRTPAMTDSTYRGCINIALDSLKRLFPTKQIVLLTPIHRAGFYRSDTNWQPTEQYQNVCGEWIDDYIESVVEAGRIWSVPVIDMNSLSGLYPLLDEQAQYFKDADTDRLHPNDSGHRRLALTLMYQLMTLPCNL